MTRSNGKTVVLTRCPGVEQHVEVCLLVSLRALLFKTGYNSHIGAVQTHNAVSSWSDGQLSLCVSGLQHTGDPVIGLFSSANSQAD